MSKWKCVIALCILCVVLLCACEYSQMEDTPSISAKQWELMIGSASGTTVNIVYSEADDVEFKKWLETVIVPMARKNNIELVIENRSISEIMKKLKNQKNREIDRGYFDIVYIKDDSFQKMYEQDFLYTSFLKKLPNYHKFIHPEDVEFSYEQGVNTQNSFVPITREQLSLVYDEDMIDYPPETMDMLIETIKSAPEQFTFPVPEDFAGKLFMHTFIANFVDYEKLYMDNLTKDEIAAIIAPALDNLRNIKPKLWKQGAEYPHSESELDDMFFKKEVAFSLSTDPNKPLSLSKEERYPYAARGFVLDDGTAGTNGGVIIPFNAPNKSGAMVVINDMISVEAQAYKYDPLFWGNIPVINTSRISEQDIKPMQKIQVKRNNVKQELFNSHRLPEISEHNSSIISELWQKTMME